MALTHPQAVGAALCGHFVDVARLMRVNRSQNSPYFRFTCEGRPTGAYWESYGFHDTSQKQGQSSGIDEVSLGVMFAPKNREVA